MNHAINELIQFALDQGLITEDERDYSANLLLDLLEEEQFSYEKTEERYATAAPILQKLLDAAAAKALIDDTVTSRDRFDTKLMNCVVPRPHTVIKTFEQKYAISPQAATDYFYRFSIASNYIRKDRTDKNIVWKQPVKYGEVEISINVSKPEKDPREIARAKEAKPTGYPPCVLCKENVGFKGNADREARQTHRIIPLSLATGRYYLQYSPYVYYNEHCIVFNREHKPMAVDRSTFENLFSFLDLFPHYMIGSNADLPIVGGSILSHDHYQGGRYPFPIQKAKVLQSFASDRVPGLRIEIVHWPLSTVRATSRHKEDLVAFAMDVLQCWRTYDAPELDILSHTGSTPHNTITPIARRVDGNYQIDLVLRNNRTNEQYPDGIFHPHPDLYHIKKENIGLIEVMGLAILPARLKEELQLLKKCLLGEKDIGQEPKLDKHSAWYSELSDRYRCTTANVDGILKREVAEKYVRVLEDAGVFKMGEQGTKELARFVKTVLKGV